MHLLRGLKFVSFLFGVLLVLTASVPAFAAHLSPEQLTAYRAVRVDLEERVAELIARLASRGAHA